jgi:hypothetical protein
MRRQGEGGKTNEADVSGSPPEACGASRGPELLGAHSACPLYSMENVSDVLGFDIIIGICPYPSLTSALPYFPCRLMWICFPTTAITLLRALHNLKPERMRDREDSICSANNGHSFRFVARRRYARRCGASMRREMIICFHEIVPSRIRTGCPRACETRNTRDRLLTKKCDTL